MSFTDMAGFVRAVRVADPLMAGADTVGRLLADVRLDSADIQPLLLFRRGVYTRTLLYANDNFEIALLCWDRGSASEIHDHAGQRCWFTTIEGGFAVENYTRLAGGQTEGFARIALSSVEKDVTIGHADYRYGHNDIHRVVVAPHVLRSVSLHVYAKPIKGCLIFDKRAERCSQKNTRWDAIATERIIL